MSVLKKTTLAVLALALAGLTALLASCNTVEGVGEDVSAMGQGLADVAADARD